MRQCRKCGCNCDPGDLVGGVCDDCRDQEVKMESRRRALAKQYIEQPDGQLVME